MEIGLLDIQMLKARTTMPIMETRDPSSRITCNRPGSPIMTSPFHKEVGVWSRVSEEVERTVAANVQMKMPLK